MEKRGVPLAVGSPSQNISILTSANETYIYGPDGICESAYSSLGCFTYRGGEYDSKESPGGKVTQERKESDDVNADWFVDTVQLQSNLSIADFAFGVPKQDLDSAYKSQAQLGLGRNASLLNALKMVGIIGSRSFSLSWGQVGGPETQQSRGSLTLGGLDQGLIENKKSATASLNHDSGCRTGMLVTIDDLLLNWPNGTDTSLFMESQSSVVQACIVPSYSGLMTMPFDYWQRFSELAGLRYPQGQETRSMGINFFTMIVGPEGVYYGDLTISLQNGVSIRVPNTELIVPDEYINKTTGQSATNDTVRNIVINPVQDINKNDLPLLGRLFLSSAYLSVNHDSGTFTLWQTDTAARKRALQALDEGNRVVTEYCTRDNGTNQPTDIPPLATATLTPEPSHGLSDGAIGGVVVGTITFIAFLGAVIFWFWRKKCGSKVAETAPQLDEWQKPRTSPSHSRLDVSVIPLELPTSYINSNKTFRVSIHQCI